MQMSGSRLRPGRHRRPGKARTTTTAWDVLPGLVRLIVDLVGLAMRIDWLCEWVHLGSECAAARMRRCACA